MYDTDQQVQGLNSICFVMQQELMSSVVELEQLRSDLHTWVDAHVAVELHVGVKDFTVEVFDTLDNARQRIWT